MARPGEVLTIRTVQNLSLRSGLRVESLGRQRLTGLFEDVDVYRVTAPTGGLSP